MQKKHLYIVISIASIFVLSLIIFIIININQDSSLISPLGKRRQEKPSPTPLPLKKYAFQNLKKRTPVSSRIILNKLITQNNGFNTYLFEYKSGDKKITGVANVPKETSLQESTLQERGTSFAPGAENTAGFPAIVMFRGWVDENNYTSGTGTQPSAQIYAQNGYITLAIDFLGYGGSDPVPDNIWESRFIKNINIQDFLASVEKGKIYQNGEVFVRINPEQIGLWGHSNGGLSALTALEISGKSYPTTLWAPVSQFFPYDVLYYTFESDDKGKFLRQKVAEFEKDYDIDKYSMDEYLGWITAPIQLHQGTGDMYIPTHWSDSLAQKLQNLGNEVNYYTYPGANHQLAGAWDLVVQRDVEFFDKYLK